MRRSLWWRRVLCLLLFWPGIAWAQEEAATEPAADAESEEPILLSPEELEQLVAPIAFYPDEVLAVTLPAATYPLDVVQAARFLEKKETTPDAEPNANWDPSVLALLNYPVVITKMNDDLDWTTSLGEAVLNQQSDVIDAIQQVRRGAYASGYLKSDEKTTVNYEEDVVEIAAADPDVVYVPVYETASAPAPAPEAVAEETTTTEGTTTEVTTNVYYPSQVAYSEPYTPYYDETATFWTGALVGGLTMGFLMDWDDDDIDIDFDDGDFDDWEPGRGDINIEGDVNIGDDIDIGNGVNVGKGDSWRKMREQRTGGEQVSQLKSTRPAKKAAQPIASQNKKPKAGQGVAKKPAQGAKVQPQKTKKAVSKQPAQKQGALGNVQRGQDTVKASKRGANSQQKVVQQQPKRQQAAPTRKPTTGASATRPRQGGQSAFGNMSSGKQAKQSSNRGSSSQKRVRPKR